MSVSSQVHHKIDDWWKSEPTFLKLDVFKPYKNKILNFLIIKVINTLTDQFYGIAEDKILKDVSCNNMRTLIEGIKIVIVNQLSFSVEAVGLLDSRAIKSNREI